MAKYQPFTLKTLYKVGASEEQFNSLLKALTVDCLSRPGITKFRELKIQLKLTPDKNDPDNVVVETIMTSKMPSRAADIYKMTTSVNGELRFQPSSPMDPHQGDLFGDEE